MAFSYIPTVECMLSTLSTRFESHHVHTGDWGAEDLNQGDRCPLLLLHLRCRCPEPGTNQGNRCVRSPLYHWASWAKRSRARKAVHTKRGMQCLPWNTSFQGLADVMLKVR